MRVWDVFIPATVTNGVKAGKQLEKIGRNGFNFGKYEIYQRLFRAR
jgi:hypothetical protein